MKKYIIAHPYKFLWLTACLNIVLALLGRNNILKIQFGDGNYELSAFIVAIIVSALFIIVGFLYFIWHNKLMSNRLTFYHVFSTVLFGFFITSIPLFFPVFGIGNYEIYSAMQLAFYLYVFLIFSMQSLFFINIIYSLTIKKHGIQ